MPNSTTTNIGDMLTYNLLISNNGSSDALDVVLSDVMPSDLTDVSFSTDNGLSWQPWTGSFNAGTMAAGAVIDLIIRGTVTGTTGNVITNTAMVSTSSTDTDLTNNAATLIVSIAPSRDDVINQILSSIAMEELGLSHILNAEGEKIQYVIGTLSEQNNQPATVQDVLNVNESVQNMLDTTATYQMMLIEKMNNALNGTISS